MPIRRYAFLSKLWDREFSDVICVAGVCRAFEDDAFKMPHVKSLLSIRGSLNDLVLTIGRVRCNHNILLTNWG